MNMIADPSVLDDSTKATERVRFEFHYLVPPKQFSGPSELAEFVDDMHQFIYLHGKLVDINDEVAELMGIDLLNASQFIADYLRTGKVPPFKDWSRDALPEFVDAIEDALLKRQGRRHHFDMDCEDGLVIFRMLCRSLSSSPSGGA